MRKRNVVIAMAIAGILCCLAIAAVILMYPTLERGYQNDMDIVRKKHASEMAALMKEFATKTGRAPFQEETGEKPVMVIIGRSAEQETHYETAPTIARDAIFKRSSELEALLSKELGRPVRLPREPQKFATFAPNVYIYFVAESQFTVAVHLANPDPEAVDYPWNDRTYYSYALSYSKKESTPVQDK